MRFNYTLKLAGTGLLLICLANFIAPKKLGWVTNLKKTELFVQQVFKVHTLFIVLTMIGMALACLGATEELILKENLITKGLVWFMAIFWTARVIVHLFYYDKTLQKKFPYWNALFLGAFIYLAGVFLTTAIL